MRITVCPSQKEQLYYYEIGDYEAKSAVLDKGVKRILSGVELFKEMQKKFDFFYEEEEDEEER